MFAKHARESLVAYLRRPEPAYHWKLEGTQALEGGTTYDLRLISLEWQGLRWEHRLQIFCPERLNYPGFCGLVNTGEGGPATGAEGWALAAAAGTLFATLRDVPNQPLFDGKVEDQLVVHTWLRFLETGDPTWPLHLPMAKAVLRAADAVQEFAHFQGWPLIEGFLVTGASKRGWAAWLTGAAGDPRVRAIAPMVIDTLNLHAQAPHQIQALGGPSEQVADYTNAGLSTKAATPEGKRLLALEDPYSHRSVLTLPKLLILGTNDRYWAQDALNLYWGGLRGPKSVLYVPNSGHDLEDRPRVLATLGAFLKATAAGEEWPRLWWRFSRASGSVTLFAGSQSQAAGSQVPAISARLFQAHAPTQDLREAHWTSTPMARTRRGFRGQFLARNVGCTALFGEVTFGTEGQTFTLSTQIRILQEEAPKASS